MHNCTNFQESNDGFLLGMGLHWSPLSNQGGAGLKHLCKKVLFWSTEFSLQLVQGKFKTRS
jgi:hypothetical protein